MSGWPRLATGVALIVPLVGFEPPTSPCESAALRKEVVAQIARARAALGKLVVDYSYPVDAQADRGGYIYHSLCFEPSVGLVLDSAHGETGISPWEWTRRQKTIIVAAGWLAVWPNKRSYAFHATKTPTVPADVKEDPLFRATGLWPMRGVFPAGAATDRSYDLEDLVLDDRYAMAWDGTRRLVFSRGAVDRFVLDGQSGYALLERTWSNAANTNIMRMQVDGLKKVADGLWLPLAFSIERIRENDEQGASEKLRGKLERTEPVAAQPLHYEPPPGAVFLDQTTSLMTQTVAGGEDYLRELSSKVRTLLAARTSVARASPLADHVWLVGVAVFFVFLAVGRRLYLRSVT